MGWREGGGGLVGESHLLLGDDLLPSLMALSPRRQTLRPHPLGGVLLGIAAWSLQHQAAGRGQAGQASSREATTTGAPTTAPRPTWQQRCSYLAAEVRVAAQRGTSPGRRQGSSARTALHRRRCWARGAAAGRSVVGCCVASTPSEAC